ncbi:DUF4333 domain-containing protein [Cellulomonas pakistanensis]|uniref:DUF4333 domain-containing protein n=1 Tax=Cellulomonas pakistanensis TaxID=992287 RepID=A0A919PC63_9CELL|nr:DUF4333 domain-containing protein [Cellulomonas pakistanensis]GIG36229.1 hypothetical protein Cpa01nite_16100 [Cellulomonas pakistanensis]
MSRPAVPVLVLASALLTAGCSLSVGTSVRVDPDDLASRVGDVLTETVGRAPDAVDCPDPLAGEVGAETRCTLDDGDLRYGLTVVATEVRGTDVRIEVEVDEEPLGAGERA